MYVKGASKERKRKEGKEGSHGVTTETARAGVENRRKGKKKITKREDPNQSGKKKRPKKEERSGLGTGAERREKG